MDKRLGTKVDKEAPAAQCGFNLKGEVVCPDHQYRRFSALCKEKAGNVHDCRDNVDEACNVKYVGNLQVMSTIMGVAVA